jgi:tellurite methyltransferase
VEIEAREIKLRRVGLTIIMSADCSFSGAKANKESSNEQRVCWDRRYREAAGTSTWTEPDAFLTRVFSEWIEPAFPEGGSGLDLAGGAGRNAIWLARQGWKVTLNDISETGIEQARQHAGPLATHMHFVVDDLTHFKASQTHFDVVMAFFYLDRKFFPRL